MNFTPQFAVNLQILFAFKKQIELRPESRSRRITKDHSQVFCINTEDSKYIKTLKETIPNSCWTGGGL